VISLFMRVLPYGLGFFLVANATPLSAAGGSVRATDLISILLTLVLLLRASGGGISWALLAAAGTLVFLPMAWSGLAILGMSDRDTLAQGLRWILAVPWALVLIGYVHREPECTRFIKGLAIGCAFNVFVVVAQFLGVDGPLQRLGFSSFGTKLVWVGEQLRMPGLHGSPTASAAVISLIAPATLWLYLRGRASLLWPVCGFAVAGVAMHLTSSRSPFLVLVLSTALTLVLTINSRRSLGLWALGLGVGSPLLLFFGPPGGWVRWTDTSDALLNASDRLLTNLSTLDLALQHPLGMGVGEGHRALFADTGIQATHNAWLQAALVFGLPFALAITAAFFVNLSRLRHGWRSDAFWPGLVAFHLSGLFLFEEHLNNPTFVILTVWLVTEAVQRGWRGSVPQSIRAS
jgi:hypothetical protein